MATSKFSQIQGMQYYLLLIPYLKLCFLRSAKILAIICFVCVRTYRITTIFLWRFSYQLSWKRFLFSNAQFLSNGIKKTKNRDFRNIIWRIRFINYLYFSNRVLFSNIICNGNFWSKVNKLSEIKKTLLIYTRRLLLQRQFSTLPKPYVRNRVWRMLGHRLNFVIRLFDENRAVAAILDGWLWVQNCRFPRHGIFSQLPPQNTEYRYFLWHLFLLTHGRVFDVLKHRKC